MTGAPLAPAVVPLVVTADPHLREEVLRLAAAAGCVPDVVGDAAGGLRAWAGAPLVLLGADLVSEVAALGPERRQGVHVVGWGRPADELFRWAVDVGAHSVVELPVSATWVVETLTDLGDGARGAGHVIGVVGGSGGAGASTFACALGQVAARTGSTVVVDADPLGPGLDRLLGLESRHGTRWDGLHHTTGRISGRALHDALPRQGRLGVLTWPAGAAAPLQPFAAREVLSAARRGHDTVVVDLARGLDPLTEELAARCDLLLVVAVSTVAGIASATRVCGRLPQGTPAHLVLRGRGAEPREVERVAGLPVLVEMAEQRGVAESVDLGLGPVRSFRGPLGRAAAAALRGVAAQGVAA